jgi:hypothetical protein
MLHTCWRLLLVLLARRYCLRLILHIRVRTHYVPRRVDEVVCLNSAEQIEAVGSAEADALAPAV